MQVGVDNCTISHTISRRISRNVPQWLPPTSAPSEHRIEARLAGLQFFHLKTYRVGTSQLFR